MVQGIERSKHAECCNGLSSRCCYRFICIVLWGISPKILEFEVFFWCSGYYPIFCYNPRKSRMVGQYAVVKQLLCHYDNQFNGFPLPPLPLPPPFPPPSNFALVLAPNPPSIFSLCPGLTPQPPFNFFPFPWS